ncbi:MAG TPA: DUF3800 domain-containing protein [Streptosporangiaceae bacterium]
MISHSRAYIDESLRPAARLYLLAAVFVGDDRVREYRATLRGLLKKRQRRLHWRDEDDRRRVSLIAAVAELRPRGIVIVGHGLQPRHQERARRKCMERLLWNLNDVGIAEAVFERRGDDMDRRDLEMVEALRGRRVIRTRLRVHWESPTVEPLLWLADLVVGAASGAEAGYKAHWKELGDGLTIERLDLD